MQYMANKCYELGHILEPTRAEDQIERISLAFDRRLFNRWRGATRSGLALGSLCAFAAVVIAILFLGDRMVV